MIRILIVEDEITIARLIDLNLSACGYECTYEYDGLAAADLLEQMSCSCLCRTGTSRCSAKRSMSASGARNSRVTAARSTCMCSDCGESWAGRESS